MLYFTVFDDDRPAETWPLAGAYLVGPDDLPAPGKIAFEPGRLACRRKTPHAVALSLPFDAGSMGRLQLQTCLLPDRDAPYILTVELARHRIKTFIAKSEEWQMFDLSGEHPAMRHWERARGKLTEALIEQDAAAAHRLGCASLELAIDATERLAMAHAEILLHRRYQSKPATSGTLGVRIWPSRDSTRIRDILAREFDVIAVPMRWRDLEVEEGRYEWERTDRWVQWARQEGKAVIGGPLLDFSRAAVPDWMYVWQNDYETCRDLAYDHIERVMHRYRGLVSVWNLASSLNVNDNFTFKPQQMLDLTRMASLLVRQVQKNARTMVELVQPFGEFATVENSATAPLTFIDQLIQEGIRVDSIGVQLLFGDAASGAGRMTRDLMQISSLLDRFFLLELPVVVSAMGAPSAMPSGGADGGWWHETWSPESQQQWLGKVFGITLSKPFVETIIWSDLVDHDQAMLPGSGLISKTGQPKPVLQRLISLRRRLRKPLGVLKLPAKPARVQNLP